MAEMSKIAKAAEGLKAFCRKHAQADVVRLLGWHKETVNAIVRGRRLPTAVQANEILAKLPIETVRVATPSPTKAIDETDPKATCLATIADLRRALAELNADPDAPVKEKAQVATALTGATRLLAKLTGETEITEAMILRSPAWKRLEVKIVQALRPFPDAMAKLGEMLDGP